MTQKELVIGNVRQLIKAFGWICVDNYDKVNFTEVIQLFDYYRTEIENKINEFKKIEEELESERISVMKRASKIGKGENKWIK